MLFFYVHTHPNMVISATVEWNSEDLEGNYIFNKGVKSLSDVLPKNSAQILQMGSWH